MSRPTLSSTSPCEAVRARRAGWGLVAMAGVLIVLNGVSSIRGCSSLRPVHRGELAPSFTIPRITAKGAIGSEFSLRETRGKIVVLDFWATWCGPCKASMPILNDIATSYASRGIVVLSINIEGAGASSRARVMADRLAPNVELLSDTGKAGALYKVNTIPHMLVLDRAGTVTWVHRGFGTKAGLRSSLEAAIEALL